MKRHYLRHTYWSEFGVHEVCLQCWRIFGPGQGALGACDGKAIIFPERLISVPKTARNELVRQDALLPEGEK